MGKNRGERKNDFKDATDPRELLWQARNAVLNTSRKDTVIARAMENAARSGIKGDGCFVMTAAVLALDRERLIENHKHERSLLEQRIAYLEARNKGFFSQIKAYIGARLKWQKA